MEEIIVSTRQIYSGRVVHLDVHEVILPDGKHSKREQIKHPGAVAIVAIDDKQNVLLVRQYRLPAGGVMIELPAGTLYPEEAPQDCAIREMQEETGFKPQKIESMGGFYAAPGYTTEFIHLFYATDLVPSALPGEDDEFLEVFRLPFSIALQMIDKGEILDSKTIIGLTRAAARTR
jgi:ADP-ribose pyrophosphatase